MKVLIKIPCLCGLLCFGFIILIGCTGNKDFPESSQSISEKEATETVVETEAKIPMTPDLSYNSPQTNRCSNYYTDAPDFPVAGQTSFTYLAQAIINTSAKDEVMYFLVYANDPENSISLFPDIPDYNYEGENLFAIQSNYESSWSNRYNYYKNLKKNGMSEKNIVTDPEYIKLDEVVNGLFKQLTYGRSARFYEVNKDTILQYIGYFKELGFKQLGDGDVNDIAWQRRMTMSGEAAQKPIMFGISGTLDDIEHLCLENEKYGIILFASDSEDHWIERNDDPYNRQEYSLYLYEIPDLWVGQVYYSYQELGIYERIWKVN